MCGIVGFNWEDKGLLQKSLKTILHRGPDGSGMYFNKGISLGHRRLSIIDLSSAGQQPMCNEEGDMWLTFNGEIYNFKELRSQLEQRGHTFKSNTDSEVLIHGYEEWGELLLEKINGQFAFAIYDEQKQRLTLARDRLGIKPLYYYYQDGTFIFASEIKAILACGIQPQMNLSAAHNYLNLRYIPGEDTLFQGIKKLLPGHVLRYEQGEIVKREFWDLFLPANRTDPLAAIKTYQHVEESVRKRLVADVPVGVYLSGGIDSGSIVALASKIKQEPVKTFSVGFNYAKYDELTKARVVADAFSTDHHEIVLQEEITPLLPKILWHLDMPHGDPVVLPMFRLAQHASQKVKVVLSGEGADEVFGGYVQYKTLPKTRPAAILPSIVTTKIGSKVPVKVFDKIYDYPTSIGEKGKEKALDLMSNAASPSKAYHHLVSILSQTDKEQLLTHKWCGGSVRFHRMRNPLLHQMMYFDLKNWLPNYPLHVNDRMTMANSIEGRVPFLDHKMVQYMNTLSTKHKIFKGTTKYVLRQAMKDHLPTHRRKKHAFYMPLDHWFKTELRDLAQNLFTKEKVAQRGFFNHYHLQKIWNNFHSSKLLYGKQLFTVINLELWNRMFIDGDGTPKSLQGMI